jgi:hypothetical protein
MPRKKVVRLRPARKLVMVAPFRAYESERDELKKRAAEAGLSLNRYLIECGLIPKITPDPMERVCREEAIFRVHVAGTRLEKLLTNLKSTGPESLISQVQELLQETRSALNLLKTVYAVPQEMIEKAADQKKI